MTMLYGERPHPGRVALVLAIIGGLAALATLKALSVASDDLDVAVPADLALVERLASATAEFSGATNERMERLEMNAAASAAATLLLQGEVRRQDAEIAELKSALGAAAERLAKAEPKPRRARKAVPDPPASSHIMQQLQ